MRDLPANFLDIFSTLADVLNVKVPWILTGHSLLDFPSVKRERIIYDYNLKASVIPDDLKSFLMAGVKR